MKKIIVLLLGTILLLAACGGSENVETAVAAEGGDTAVVTNTSTVSSEDGVQLNADYADALSVQGQLALGTIQLADTDLSVDQAQAETLLPYWQALNSLVQSGTAADAETNAVIKQIQNNMTAEQINAIAALQLTQESMSELVEPGQARGGGSADGAGRSAGGLPGERPGGGGGFPGGGPGGGDPGAIETRQAEITAGGSDFLESMLTNLVVRNLEAQASGIDPADRFNPYQEAVAAVSEVTGVSVEDIQAQTAEGKTLAEIVTENGGDLDDVSAVLIETFTDSTFLGDQDPATAVEEFLNNRLNRAQNSGNTE